MDNLLITHDKIIVDKLFCILVFIILYIMFHIVGLYNNVYSIRMEIVSYITSIFFMKPENVMW